MTVLAVCLCPNSSSQAGEDESRRKVTEEAELFQTWKWSVFTVFSDNGKGSGFLVDSALGLVATNSHVVGDGKRLRVKLEDELVVEGVLVANDSENDVAIVRIHPEFTDHIAAMVLSSHIEGDRYAFVGERVLAIGSPLNQELILTTGVISKVEKGVIITDVAINPGNSGGPLVNLDGDVIAINTFRDPSPGSPGIAGSVSVVFLKELLSIARDHVDSSTEPGLKRFPTMPKEQFSFACLRQAALSERWDELSYNITRLTNTGNFRVLVLTPPFMYWAEHTARVQMAKKSKEKSQGSNAGAYDPFEDLKSWTQYLGKYSPVVMFYVEPKVGETSGSIWGNALGAFGAGLAGTAHYSQRKYEFKADISDLDITVGESVKAEIHRGISWQPLTVQGTNFWGSYSGEDLARVALGVYEVDAFVPGPEGWPIVELTVKDAREDKARTVKIPQRTLERIAVDFERHRWEQRAKRLRRAQ